MTPPPLWTDEQLLADIDLAIGIFRRERMQEPLEAYIEDFDRARGFVEDLLKTSADLAEIHNNAIDILTNSHLLEALRSAAGPPLSADDLKTLSEAVLSPGRLRQDSAMAHRVVDVVRLGLDRRRFPWILENREPSDQERAAAVLASAALMATRRVGTARRSEGKDTQELLVESTLSAAGLKRVDPRPIPTLNHDRIAPIECKVSNSALNSIKRVNNDAAVKAEVWLKDFGTRNIVPAAVLSGVCKLRHLAEAQNRGLTLFWAHDLQRLVTWANR